MSYIHDFCSQYDFPADAIIFLDADHQRLEANPQAYSIFCTQVGHYDPNAAFDHIPVFEALHGLTESTGIHPYTLDLLYLISLMPALEDWYRQEEIDPQLFHNFARNLAGVASDCFGLHGVWGTYIGWWLIDFFKGKLFSFGRLQFRRRKLRRQIGKYPQGIYYLDVHVPPCGPLTPALCEESYAQAASFYRARYGMEEILIGCHSWLIHPDITKLLPETSNILAFGRRYQVLETMPDPESKAASFIFNLPTLPADLNNLPDNTSLRRAVKQHLLAGNTIDTAFGFMHYAPNDG